jgi:hypothetical protein
LNILEIVCVLYQPIGQKYFCFIIFIDFPEQVRKNEALALEFWNAGIWQKSKLQLRD